MLEGEVQATRKHALLMPCPCNAQQCFPSRICPIWHPILHTLDKHSTTTMLLSLRLAPAASVCSEILASLFICIGPQPLIVIEPQRHPRYIATQSYVPFR